MRINVRYKTILMALLLCMATAPMLAQQSIDVDPADMLRRPVAKEVYEHYDQVGRSAQSLPYSGMRHASKLSLGLGMGLDYGGFGMNLNYYPMRNLGIFGGIGYPFQSVGLNVGLRFRHIPLHARGKVNPFGIVMYGYNTSVNVSGAEEYNRLFYGLTMGAGVDFYPWTKGGPGYFTFGLLIPMRSPDVGDYLLYVDAQPDINLDNYVSPIALTLGFKLFLKKY